MKSHRDFFEFLRTSSDWVRCKIPSAVPRNQILHSQKSYRRLCWVWLRCSPTVGVVTDSRPRNENRRCLLSSINDSLLRTNSQISEQMTEKIHHFRCDSSTCRWKFAGSMKRLELMSIENCANITKIFFLTENFLLILLLVGNHKVNAVTFEIVTLVGQAKSR